MKNDCRTIDIAASISTTRSYADLIVAIREKLPQYFEFEGVAILLKDGKTN